MRVMKRTTLLRRAPDYDGTSLTRADDGDQNRMHPSPRMLAGGVHRHAETGFARTVSAAVRCVVSACPGYFAWSAVERMNA